MLGPQATNAIDDLRVLNVLRRQPSFEEALARLLFLVEHRRPCGIVLGLSGVGKSALFEVLRQELETPSSVPIAIDLRTISASALPRLLSSGMGLSPPDHERPETLWRMIEDRIEGAASARVSYIPLLDHLNQADEEMQGAIRRCCHLMARSGSTTLLSGSPPLPTGLSDMVRSLCDLRIELPLWSADETTQFVTQVQEAADAPRCTATAIAAIQTCSDGRLRDVHQICRLASFAAQSQGIDVINDDLLKTIASDIWQPTTHPLPDLPAEPAILELSSGGRVRSEADGPAACVQS